MRRFLHLATFWCSGFLTTAAMLWRFMPASHAAKWTRRTRCESREKGSFQARIGSSQEQSPPYRLITTWARDPQT
ncbi:unnamed protein product [Symbiodinium natans]|uniref:Uncharacterized protein n=1 Tax=Symbiodinium natans TaxID=878477 RepID=A0A812VDN5_9DINO|nr:unnamed protein product [Symbiodinium natans]